MSQVQDPLYEMAIQETAYYLVPHSGYLRISGEDRDDFLQRQTTNDIRSLNADSALLTVLTSSTARVIDVFYLLREPESVGVITMSGSSAKTSQFLQNRIFFMDKVTVIDSSEEVSQIVLLGPRTNDILNLLGVQDVPKSNQVKSSDLDGLESRLFVPDRSIGMGVRLVIHAGAENDVAEMLENRSVPRLDNAHYEVIRVENGIPGPGTELSEDYTPLEIGLEPAISDSKGCYTGQEVIARQITYDKVTRSLCGLRLDGQVNPGDQVKVEDKFVGNITSTAWSPRFGDISLAILKRPYFELGSHVVVGEVDGESIEARVVPLPFR